MVMGDPPADRREEENHNAWPAQNDPALQDPLKTVTTTQRAYDRPLMHRNLDISRENILDGFRSMSAYIRDQGHDITIMTVGGAISAVYLQTRETSQVDYFGASEHFQLIRDASRHTQQQSTTQLGTAWINNNVALFASQALQTQLLQESLQQNVILFRERGLTVVAAPWLYCICGKIERMVRRSERPYDCADAVAYLYEYIRSNGGPVPAAVFVEKGREYGTESTTDVLQMINALFRQTHGRDGIAI